jgi:hypothetical protein
MVPPGRRVTLHSLLSTSSSSRKVASFFQRNDTFDRRKVVLSSCCGYTHAARVMKSHNISHGRSLFSLLARHVQTDRENTVSRSRPKKMKMIATKLRLVSFSVDSLFHPRGFNYLELDTPPVFLVFHSDCSNRCKLFSLASE